MTIRVVVVDDQTLIRAGLVGIVNTASDLEVVGEAADGDEAVRVVHADEPDVVLMDIRMPGTDGLEATRQITETTSARVLILTTFDLDEYVYAALRNGASGFLLKDAPPADLLTAVRVIARGDALLAPGITRRLIDTFARRPSSPAHRPSTTCSPPRQTANARFSRASRWALRTTRSPASCTSAPGPPRPISHISSRSSTPVTVCIS